MVCLAYTRNSPDPRWTEERMRGLRRKQRQRAKSRDGHRGEECRLNVCSEFEIESEYNPE